VIEDEWRWKRSIYKDKENEAACVYLSDVVRALLALPEAPLVGG
jgi:hypothetical protein